MCHYQSQVRVAAVKAVGRVWADCGAVHGIALELLVDMFNDEKDQVNPWLSIPSLGFPSHPLPPSVANQSTSLVRCCVEVRMAAVDAVAENKPQKVRVRERDSQLY